MLSSIYKFRPYVSPLYNVLFWQDHLFMQA